MDLREMLRTPAAVARGCEVLNYQPFILSDEVQTGAAYSWVYGVNTRSNPPVVFHRRDYDEDEWRKISDSNARQRQMYDDFTAFIAARYPGGSLLDVACNNGYFPVKAQLLGMKHTCGCDGGPHFRDSIVFLNKILGTSAEFIHSLYDPRQHDAPVYGSYDVVLASAILCHLADPLEFLSFLGSLANEAIFFFGQVIDTDEFLVSFQRPHPDLAVRGIDLLFPYRFNDVTRVSRGLIFHAFEEMGFGDIQLLDWRDAWLSPYIGIGQREPLLEGENPEALREAWRLYSDVTQGSKHLAILAGRRPGKARPIAERKPPPAAIGVDSIGQPLQAPLELVPLLARTPDATGSDAAVFIAATAAPGHFLYGPYIRLEPGEYRLDLDCLVRGAAERRAILLALEIVIGEISIVSRTFRDRDLARRVSIPFEITEALSALGPGLEFRLSHYGCADLEIAGARLSPAPPP